MRARTRSVLRRFGFDIVQDDDRALVAERNVLADFAATHRADRPVWAVIGGGVLLLAAGLAWTAGRVGSASSASLAPPVGLAVLGALLTALPMRAFANGWYWSDLAAVFAAGPAVGQSPRRETAPSGASESTVVVLGRGLTHDWERRRGGGRTVVTVAPDPSIDDVGGAIEEAIRAPVRPPP